MQATRARTRRMQICANNRLARRPELAEKLRSMGYILEIESCLDQCTRCDHCAFALVCGRFLFGRTSEDFVRKLKVADALAFRRAKGLNCDA